MPLPDIPLDEDNHDQFPDNELFRNVNPRSRSTLRRILNTDENECDNPHLSDDKNDENDYQGNADLNPESSEYSLAEQTLYLNE